MSTLVLCDLNSLPDNLLEHALLLPPPMSTCAAFVPLFYDCSTMQAELLQSE